MKKILLSIALVVFGFGIIVQDARAVDLKGLILINVDSGGEAWYVNPVDNTRYFLGRPIDALSVVRKLALGVSKQSLADIQRSVPARLLGKILLVVDDAGKAYYLNPKDRKIYALGGPDNMFATMKATGLGITKADLDKISIAPESATPPLPGPSSQNSAKYLAMEKIIQELVNDERVTNGLGRLKWNDALAVVARRHSQDQANENSLLINPNRLCSYPFIHHEGIEVGLYHADRLAYYKLFYHSASAENIALIPESKESSYRSAGVIPQDCQAEVNALNKTYEEDMKKLATDTEKIKRVKDEMASRANLTVKSPAIQVIENFNSTFEQIEKQAVTGWMNSPGHRKNILNGEYDEAGMGIANVNGYFIITQVFIKRAACGFKEGACCQKPGYYPFCFVPLGCSADNLCQ